MLAVVDDLEDTISLCRLDGRLKFAFLPVIIYSITSKMLVHLQTVAFHRIRLV